METSMAHIVMEFVLKNFPRKKSEKAKKIILTESAIVFNKGMVVDDHFKIIPGKKRGASPTIKVKYDSKKMVDLSFGLRTIMQMLEAKLGLGVIKWEHKEKIKMVNKKKG